MSFPVQLDSLSMATALLLGLRHALEPGHGKAVIATYMGQPQARYLDVLKLGGIISIAHSLVLILSVILFFRVFQSIEEIPQVWLDTLQVVSACVIVVLGTLMFIRSRRVLNGTTVGSTCATACQHDNRAADQINASSPKGRELFLLGLMSGLRPCPLTLTGLMMAISLGQFEALAFILVFSVGMAIVLMGVGLLGKLAGTSLEEATARYQWLANVQRWLPFISALLILAMGVVFLAISVPKLL